MNPRRASRGSRKIAAAIIALFLAGCSAGGEDATPGQDDSLQAIIDHGVLRASACLTLPPFGMISTSGEPEGFDVDILREYGEYIGVEVDITEVTGPGRVASLQSGQADVSACTFSITPERLEEVWFTDPLLRAGTSLIVTQGSDISSVADLDGKRVANTKGGGAIPIIEAEAPGAELVLFDTVNDVFLALRQGQVDAAIESAHQVSAAAAEDDTLVIVADGTVGEPLYQALGVAKGNQELLDSLNEYIAEFHSSGRDVELFEKWFTFEATNQFTDLPATQNIP